MFQFIRDLFSTDSSLTTPETSSSMTEMSSSGDGDSRSNREDASSSTTEPSVFNGWGCGSGVQSAAEASSIAPSFSVTTQTWGSIDCGSSSSSGGIDW
jgi:hypothetical protein